MKLRDIKMNIKKTAYELKQSQVKTPQQVIDFFWQLMDTYRMRFDKVLDVGAGDGRFAVGGKYLRYDGVEIDRDCLPHSKLPKNAFVKYGCAFEHKGKNYDACIGNPPYVRHHNIEEKWRDKIIERVNSELEISLNRQCNLFVYFICLAIMKTEDDGIISLLIPYEWVSRPSVKTLRNYIKDQGWTVDVYRFKKPIFERVETTASITVISKRNKTSRWKFYDVDNNFNIHRKKNMLSSNQPFLKYENRSQLWAMRGLSPGTQRVFTLSERERLKHNLTLKDVMPCVTTLKNIPQHFRILNKKYFKKYFVNPDCKCWLIRSNKNLSFRLKKYLTKITEEERNTSTCVNRHPWYKYKCHPSPKILYNSGFTKKGPRFLINKIKAVAVGSVHGVHFNNKIKAKGLQQRLLKIGFEKRVIPHSGVLKKIEVKQMNGILNQYMEEVKRDG